MIYFAHGDEVHEVAQASSPRNTIIIIVMIVLLGALLAAHLKFREVPSTKKTVRKK